MDGSGIEGTMGTRKNSEREGGVEWRARGRGRGRRERRKRGRRKLNFMWERNPVKMKRELENTWNSRRWGKERQGKITKRNCSLYVRGKKSLTSKGKKV